MQEEEAKIEAWKKLGLRAMTIKEVRRRRHMKELRDKALSNGKKKKWLDTPEKREGTAP